MDSKNSSKTVLEKILSLQPIEKGKYILILTQEQKQEYTWDTFVRNLFKIKSGTVIPKPETNDEKVKGWGKRRKKDALIYIIPPDHEKGVNLKEFKQAFDQLTNNGDFTRKWFKNNMLDCNKEGGCNFTTIGGIFVLLGIAKYMGEEIDKIYSPEESL